MKTDHSKTPEDLYELHGGPFDGATISVPTSRRQGGLISVSRPDAPDITYLYSLANHRLDYAGYVK